MCWGGVVRGVVSNISKELQSFKAFGSWRWRQPRCFKTWGGTPYSTTKFQIPEVQVLSTYVEVIWKVPKTIFRQERGKVTVRWKKVAWYVGFSLYVWSDIVTVMKLRELVICRARSTHDAYVECVHSCSRGTWRGDALWKAVSQLESPWQRYILTKLEASCGLDRVLCTGQSNCRLYKRRGISNAAERTSASQGGLCFV